MKMLKKFYQENKLDTINDALPANKLHSVAQPIGAEGSDSVFDQGASIEQRPQRTENPANQQQEIYPENK